jgi:hydrogenase large subunit
MPTITTIDPVTRLEGHLKITVAVDVVNGEQRVVDASATGTLFRGFENLLVNRDPWDAQHITQRICGVCPVSHSIAAVLAQDQAYGITPTPNGRIIRNLILASNYLQSHILHFYHLAALDFVDGPNMPPWQPSWRADKRLTQADNSHYVTNYVKALEMRRKAHEMGAIFGGRMPCPPSLIPGGVTTQLTAAAVTQFRAYLKEITQFIGYVYRPDVQLLGTKYPDYAQIGKGWGNLIAYGVFPLDQASSNLLLKRGVLWNTTPVSVQPLNVSRITESVGYSWYAAGDDNKNPSAGATNAQYPKGSAYSWLKSPRYQSQPFEAGPLARMTMTDGKPRGVSVLARHLARADEALYVAQAMFPWLDQLVPGAACYTPSQVPAGAVRGVGLTEAPRGAIGHWIQLNAGKIASYQIVTPTCWNASPKDSRNVRGPLEKALMGTPVKDIKEPIEVLRVIHSFDPCLSCAVHVSRPDEHARIFAVPHTHGEETGHAHDHDHEHAHGHSHSHEHAH